MMTMRAQCRLHVGLAAALLVACQEDLVSNPRFDSWCGNSPCDWEVEGKVSRVGSWHSADWAVSLDRDGTQLSQLGSSSFGTCIEVQTLADIEDGTDVFLELDFFDDGFIDYSASLPGRAWTPKTALLQPLASSDVVRYILRKEGKGRAVIGQVRIVDNYDNPCLGEPIEVLHRPDRWPCEEDDTCASGVCGRSGCAACDEDEHCPEGELCGVEFRAGDYAPSCVSAQSKQFGEHCSADEQCQSGVCCEEVCSECCDRCDNGALCVVAEPEPQIADSQMGTQFSANVPAMSFDAGGLDAGASEGAAAGADAGGPGPLQDDDFPSVDALFSFRYPWQCNMAQGRRPGETCARHDDCASGTCLDAGLVCAYDCAGDPCPVADCLAWRVNQGVCQ